MGNRHKDANWTIEGEALTYEQAQLAVLMDLRDELKKLNALLHCGNFVAIPGVLREIRENTKPRKKRRKRPALKVVA